MKTSKRTPGGGGLRRGIRWGLGVRSLAVACALALGGAVAAEPGESVLPSSRQAPVLDEGFRTALAWQIALEHYGYSPGVLDGAVGQKTRTAIAAVQTTQGLKPTGRPDAALARVLGVDTESVLTTYVVTEADAREVEAGTDDWNERSRRTRLTYVSLGDLVREKFHTTFACLAKLNPGLTVEALRVGDAVRVPARPPEEKRMEPAVSLIEIDLERRVVLLLLEDEQKQRYLQGLLHCSVAADLAKAPVGEYRVGSVAENPTYTFRPEDWPEVSSVQRTLDIPPGPRNPVGVRWIGLAGGARTGLGIHGTPEPENIGRTGSHGCFRLTNWDAVWLARLVRTGIPVRIYARATETSWGWR